MQCEAVQFLFVAMKPILHQHQRKGIKTVLSMNMPKPMLNTSLILAAFRFYRSNSPLTGWLVSPSFKEAQDESLASHF